MWLYWEIMYCTERECSCTERECGCTVRECSCTERDCNCTVRECSCAERECSCTVRECNCTERECNCTERECSCTERECSCTEREFRIVKLNWWHGLGCYWEADSHSAGQEILSILRNQGSKFRTSEMWRRVRTSRSHPQTRRHTPTSHTPHQSVL